MTVYKKSGVYVEIIDLTIWSCEYNKSFNSNEELESYDRKMKLKKIYNNAIHRNVK